MRITQFFADDWERARAIRIRSLQDAPDAFGTTLEYSLTLSPTTWQERLASSDAATFVAVVDNNDVGMAVGSKEQAIVIENAMKATLAMQKWPKTNQFELGGWRYLNAQTTDNSQSDLSVTAWQLKFLRSAKTAVLKFPSKRLPMGSNTFWGLLIRR